MLSFRIGCIKQNKLNRLPYVHSIRTYLENKEYIEYKECIVVIDNV